MTSSDPCHCTAQTSLAEKVNTMSGKLTVLLVGVGIVISASGVVASSYQSRLSDVEKTANGNNTEIAVIAQSLKDHEKNSEERERNSKEFRKQVLNALDQINNRRSYPERK